MRRVDAFPPLPRWRRRDVATLRAALRRLAPHARPCGDLLASDGWRSLLGASLAVAPGVPSLAPRDEARARFERTALVAVFEHPAVGVVLVAVDRPFGRALALRALGVREDPALVHAPPSEALAPAWEGALSALAARAASSLYRPAAPPVLRAITDDARDAFDALGSCERALVWPWALTADALSGAACVVADARALLRAPEPPPPWPARAAEVPVAFSVLAARAEWTADEAASLRAGDALALDSVRALGGVVAGDVTLRLGAGPSLECAARLRDARSATLTGPLEIPTMHDPDDAAIDDAAPSHERVGLLSVELTVEVARGHATVAELAAWRVGEVVPFDTRVGDAVVVRAGGRPVARGELVDVEGDVGVRITVVL